MFSRPNCGCTHHDSDDLECSLHKAVHPAVAMQHEYLQRSGDQGGIRIDSPDMQGCCRFTHQSSMQQASCVHTPLCLAIRSGPRPWQHKQANQVFRSSCQMIAWMMCSTLQTGICSLTTCHVSHLSRNKNMFHSHADMTVFQG